MGRFSEKQMILATIVVALLLSAGFGALIWHDRQEIYAAELSEDNPSAAEISDPEQWGEKRKIQEIKKQMDAAKQQADLIPKREQDVIVYREIVHRDAQILPEHDDVNNLARQINDFETQSGVSLRQVSDLSINSDGETIKTMPIKLVLSGTFDQFLKFLNLFENHDRIINVRAFSITAGKASGQGRERRAVHEIQLDLVTYIYSPTAGIAKTVDIAKYDQRKEEASIQKLVRQQKPARVEKYQLKPRINRRDPLMDPRRPGGADAPAGDPADTQKQRDVVDKLKFDIDMLKEDVRQLAQFVQDKKYVAYSGLKPIVDEKCAKLDGEIAQASPTVTAADLREAFRDDVETPFEGIKSQLKLTGSLPPILAKKDAQQFLETMKTAMESREYEKVQKTFASFETMSKGQEIAEDAADVVTEMKDLAKQSQVMIDFLALHLKASGVIIRDGGSIVILNGKMRKIGEFVDPANRCRLKEIHTERLVFELDGLEIEHDLIKK